MTKSKSQQLLEIQQEKHMLFIACYRKKKACFFGGEYHKNLVHIHIRSNQYLHKCVYVVYLSLSEVVLVLGFCWFLFCKRHIQMIRFMERIVDK